MIVADRDGWDAAESRVHRMARRGQSCGCELLMRVADATDYEHKGGAKD